MADRKRKDEGQKETIIRVKIDTKKVLDSLKLMGGHRSFDDLVQEFIKGKNGIKIYMKESEKKKRKNPFWEDRFNY